MYFINVFKEFNGFFRTISGNRLFRRIVFFFFVLFYLCNTSFLFSETRSVFRATFDVIQLKGGYLEDASTVGGYLANNFLLDLIRLMRILFRWVRLLFIYVTNIFISFFWAFSSLFFHLFECVHDIVFFYDDKE